MEKLDSYKVDLKGMTEDAVSHHWVLSDCFFSAVQGPEIEKGEVDVTLRVKRTSEAFELDFRFEGVVEVECDRCLEPIQQSVHGACTLKAVLGDEDSDDGELITVAQSPGVMDLSWPLYEMIALEIPIRHVHPDGQCDAEVMKRLEDRGSSEQTDPRWDALKELKTKTNNKE